MPVLYFGVRNEWRCLISRCYTRICVFRDSLCLLWEPKPFPEPFLDADVSPVNALWRQFFSSFQIHHFTAPSHTRTYHFSRCLVTVGLVRLSILSDLLFPSRSSGGFTSLYNKYQVLLMISFKSARSDLFIIVIYTHDVHRSLATESESIVDVSDDVYVLCLFINQRHVLHTFR